MSDRLVRDVNTAIQIGEVATARRIAEQALAAAPDHPAAFNAMALVEAAERRYDEAARWHERAVGAAPGDAGYRIGQAYFDIQRGAFERAKERLLATLEIDPASASAFQQLAAIHKASPGDPLIVRLESVSKSERASKRSRERYHYALGKWCDDIGEYDRAFAHFREANELREHHFDRDSYARNLDSVQAIWSADFIDARKAHGFDSDKPVFIVGMPRSGSTLIAQKLCDDPRVATIGERPELIKLTGTISRNHPRQAPYPQWAPDLPDDAYGGFGRVFVARLEAILPDAMRIVDKTLNNFAYCGLIRALTPRSLIIETRRHPLDTCLSCYFQDFGAAHSYKSNLADLGWAYRKYAGLMEHWRGAVDRLITVDYETFIDDAEGCTQRLHAEIGLTPAADVASQREAGYIETWSAYQARQPVYQSSRARWKNYEPYLGPLLDEMADILP